MGTFTAHRDGSSEAWLELTRGGTHVSVRAAEIDELARAVFVGVAPKAIAEGSHVRIEYPRFAAAGLLRHPSHRTAIELATAVPWTLVFEGGLGDSNVDLSRAELRELFVVGGAGSVRIVLPEPRGAVRVRIGGGASNVAIVHPDGTAVSLRIAGGSSKLAFDGRQLPALGGETRLETAGAGDAADRYELEILGGASRLTVTEPGAELENGRGWLASAFDGGVDGAAA